MVRAAAFLSALALAGSALAAPAATLTLKGPDGATKALTAADFAKLPREKVTLTQRGETRTYEGVEMLEALRVVGAPYGDTLTGKELADVAVATAQVGRRVEHARERRAAIPRRAHRVALAAQRPGRRLRDVAVVLHEQHARHRPSL